MDSPQELLNQIHATGIFILDPEQFTSMTDRADQAKQIRPQLLSIRERVHEAQAALQHQPENTNAYRHLPAYQLLDDILGELELALRAFINDAEARIPRYGTVFFEQDNRWHIGTQRQVEALRLERQAQTMAQPMQNVEISLRDVRSKLKVTQRDLYRHSERPRGVRVGIVGVALSLMGVGASIVLQNLPVLILTGVGLVLVIVSAVMFLRWRQHENRLVQRMQDLHRRGQELTQQQEALQARHAEIASKRQTLET